MFKMISIVLYLSLPSVALAATTYPDYPVEEGQYHASLIKKAGGYYSAYEGIGEQYGSEAQKHFDSRVVMCYKFHPKLWNGPHSGCASLMLAFSRSRDHTKRYLVENVLAGIEKARKTGYTIHASGVIPPNQTASNNPMNETCQQKNRWSDEKRIAVYGYIIDNQWCGIDTQIVEN